MPAVKPTTSKKSKQSKPDNSLDLVASALTKEQIKEAIVNQLHRRLGTDENKANDHAWWKAACAAVNEQVLEQLRKTQVSLF